MAAPAGNNYNLKYKTPEERQALCAKYCAYLENGDYATYFPDCDHKTIDQYILDYPEDFPLDKIEAAFRANKRWLFDRLKDGMMGKIPQFKEKTAVFLAQNILKFTNRSDVTSGGETIKQVPPNIVVTDQETANFVKKMLSGSDDSSRP
jgi:hypothetical protein